MVKVLLCGQIHGQWETVLERAKKLNEASIDAPFEVLFCLGGIFPLPETYLKGKKQVPIPTYFITGNENTWVLSDEVQKEIYERIENHDLNNENPLEIVKNLFFLGKRGLTKIARLNIAFLSGSYFPKSKSHSVLLYSQNNVLEFSEALQQHKSIADIDFFLTLEYPSNFTNMLSQQQIPVELQNVQHEVEPLKHVFEAIFPKYHITSSTKAGQIESMFYQRLPYVSIGKYKQITRLIGLAGVNSIKDKNKKWLHALQVQPSNEQSVDDKKNIEIPAGTTQNPYLTFVPFQRDARTEPMTKKQRIVGGLSAEQVAHLKTQSANEARQFFFDSKFASKGQQQQLQFDRHKTHHHPKVSERTECWFCLSTPSVERHLIVSIGMEAYLAIPKGAIVPDHILIIPIVHESSVMRLSDACIEEINKFKQALKKMFASQNKEIILFDRNIATIGATHTHLQIVPVPKTNATHAREIFEQEGAKYNVKFEVIQEDEDLHKVTDGREYFYAEVPDGKRGHVRLIHIVQEKQYMQFGRHAAAMVLEMPRHANWKYCVVSKEEEIEMTQTFKKMFQPYDFSLEDDDEV